MTRLLSISGASVFDKISFTCNSDVDLGSFF